MKINNLIYVLAVLFFASCGNDYDVADNFDLQELPGYVAFNAPGNDATLPDNNVDENAGTVEIGLETPTGTLSDITINYELSGNAVEGVDYSIDGVSGTSGSIVLEHDPSDFENRDEVDLVVNILTDDVFDETKTLVITLTSASNAEGNLAVGRGGTDFLKTAVINIANVDCGFDDISAEFTYVTTDYFCEGGEITGTSRLNMVTESSFVFEDWGFGTYEACYGGSAANWGTLALDFCSNVVSVSGVDNYDDAWTFEIMSVDGPSMTIRFENPYPEFGTSVLTKTDGTDWPPLTN